MVVGTEISFAGQGSFWRAERVEKLKEPRVFRKQQRKEVRK